MNIISIDTSSQSVGITADGCLGSFTSVFTSANKRVNSHASLLLPSIQYAVEQAGFKISETDLVLCPQGPGSFTGLRIAYSAAKAIQLKASAKFYAIPVLPLIAYFCGLNAEQCLAIIDAKRDCFYTQLFKNNESISSPQDILAQDIIKSVNLEKPLVVCGIGTNKFLTDISDIVCINNIQFIEFFPEHLSKYMLDYFLKGNECIEVAENDGPMYIRKSDAER